MFFKTPVFTPYTSRSYYKMYVKKWFWVIFSVQSFRFRPRSWKFRNFWHLLYPNVYTDTTRSIPTVFDTLRIYNSNGQVYSVLVRIRSIKHFRYAIIHKLCGLHKTRRVSIIAWTSCCISIQRLSVNSFAYGKVFCERKRIDFKMCFTKYDQFILSHP